MMVDPAKFFRDGKVPCQRCGRLNDFGSSQALYHANIATPCVYCGFRFLQHKDQQMQKLMEMTTKDPEWREMLKNGPIDVLKQRLDALVPIPTDESQDL